MANINLTLTPASPTGSLVFTIGTPGPQGLPGPQGPAGPTFTGGPITSPITYDAGTNSTAFENGDVFAQDNTSGSYGAIYTGGLQTFDGTLTIDITGAGIRFGDNSFQSTAFPGSGAFYPATGNPSGFLTASSLSGYATESWVTAGFYPLTGNPSAFLVAADLAGYATESFVTSQGYLTDAPSDGSQYARQDGAWSVVTGGGGGDYLPLAGGTMTGPIVFDGTSGQYISKGNFDTARGGNYGISLVCSIGYEFNWQAGWLTTTNQGSVTPRPLYLDSLAGTTLRAWDSETDTGVEVAHNGIIFPDATVQTTAATPFNGGAIGSNIDWNDGGNNQTATIGLQGLVVTNQFDYDYQVSIGGDNWQGIAVTNYNGDVTLSINKYGITFPDSTVQSSAAFVPGSGNLDMTGYDITNANFNSSAGQVSAQNVSLSSGGSITFGDSTVQTTAYTGGGGGGLPAVQIAASAINPSTLTFSPSPQCVALTYPTHTDVLNGTYATAITYSNDSVGNPALILSDLTALTAATVANNTSMTSAPSFSGCTSLSIANVFGNTSMTSAPSFSGLTSLYTANVYGNTSMTSAPDFTGLTALNNANVSDNALMTSAPSFSGCTSLYTASVYSNASMTSAPSFSGLTSLYTANVYSNASMTSAPDFSGLTSLYVASIYDNASMTSAPSFSGCTALYNANVSGNASMTSAPDFSGLTSLYVTNISSNPLMTSAPSFSGCTSLYTAQVYGNASMTSAPDFSGLTSLYNAYVDGNTSMISAPNFSGCTALNNANVSNNTSMTSAPDFTTITQSGIQINLNSCAISDCTTPLDQLDAGGGSSGFIDLSGGSNQSIDPTYGSLLSLQAKGWTVVFNSL